MEAFLLNPLRPPHDMTNNARPMLVNHWFEGGLLDDQQLTHYALPTVAAV